REERAARLVLRHRDERAVEDFAGHVFSLGVGAQAVERVPIDGVQVPVVERGERTAVSAGGTSREIHFIFIRWSIAGWRAFVDFFRSLGPFPKKAYFKP